MSETRTQLKSLAIDQIRQANLQAASFRELGKAAGIKSSSVHYHFQSRDKLLTELLHDYDMEFFEHLDVLTEGIHRPKERLKALVSVFEQSHAEKRQCMSLAYAASPHELSDTSLAAVDKFIFHLENWVTDTLQNASLLPVPRDELACVIVAALEGSLLFDRLHDDPRHLNAARRWIASLSSY
ncbi:MAG: hypothetical protein CSH36_06475 [Thalassolituus sp.]|jgi:TetR/AcrR family transcriptional repressor of nem operon|uniref:TetR/AcrR family transcriptional regulator n=1 Tax=Thalassolituus sp. TaxID=2030822 RepID=UPI0035184263|nr:MAG: hypothetical protein CSH36_06475 [Thalassolituus sp.]